MSHDLENPDCHVAPDQSSTGAVAIAVSWVSDVSGRVWEPSPTNRGAVTRRSCLCFALILRDARMGSVRGCGDNGTANYALTRHWSSLYVVIHNDIQRYTRGTWAAASHGFELQSSFIVRFDRVPWNSHRASMHQWLQTPVRSESTLRIRCRSSVYFLFPTLRANATPPARSRTAPHVTPRSEPLPP